jgi:L-amino acid N-acyltransferase YncA
MYQQQQLRIRPALPEDAQRIAAIYNQGIEERMATFETRLRSVEEIRAAIASDYPMLVAIGVDDAVLGWASLSAYRSRACYAGIAEFSIYLDRPARGRGIGKQLLVALLEAAATRGYWKLVSRVFLFNIASRALCRTCGFRELGIYEKHAKLDGAWLDVVIVEKLLPVNLK